MVHNADLRGPQAVLRILLALVIEAGGELRVAGAGVDGLDSRRLLVADYDREHNQLVLRATSDFGRVVVVQPEGHEWSAPKEESLTERRRLAATEAAEHRSLRSDEALAEMEERLARETQVADDAEAGKSPLRIRVQK